MQSAATDEVAELRQKVHELELKLISVTGLATRQEASRSWLEERHEMWRSTFLDMFAIMMVVVTFVFTFLAVQGSRH